MAKQSKIQNENANDKVNITGTLQESKINEYN